MLVKASYILELVASGEILPRRQDLPERAIVGPKMLERIFKELDALDGNRFHALLEMHFPALVVVSYAWQAKEHPDGQNQMLREVLAPAIEWYMSERAAYIQRKGFDGKGKAGNFTLPGWSSVASERGETPLESVDFGLFIDYPSMYQWPRDTAQDEIFKRALNQMDMLYAHQLTVKFRLTWQLSKATGLPYGKRGWPFFETAVAAMISSSWHVLDLGKVDWTVPVEYPIREWTGTDSRDTEKVQIMFDGKAKPFETLAKQGSYHYRNETVGVAALLKYGRRPPLLPKAFATAMASKTFTNNADLTSVIQMHARVCTDVLSNVETLSYNDLGWGSFEAQDLAKVLLACPKLKSIELYKNPWGERGVEALAMALSAGSLDHVEFLGLDCSGIGDRGAISIASLIEDGKLPKLNHLRFYAGHIKDDGFRALIAAFKTVKRKIGVELGANPEGQQKKEFQALLKKLSEKY